MTANHTQDNDDRLIDRLVDGELPEDARRALLARLDAVPDGWRRCALAFLEAQVWRETFAPVAAGCHELSSVHPAEALSLTESKSETRAPHRFGAGRTAAALAASLLTAFTLGWMARGGRTGAENGAEIHTSPVTIAKTESPNAPTLAQADPTETKDGHQPPAPMLMPDPIVARLESRGYQVDRRQRLIAVETKDGRRMTMPIEEVRLRFVGDRTY
jgi:hypothetical protein